MYGCQKEGDNFLNLLQKDGGGVPRKGAAPSEKGVGCSNPWGNCALWEKLLIALYNGWLT